MNTSALLFIILGFWIFTLQSKIKHLEKLVNGLKDKKPYVPSNEEETVKDELQEVSEELSQKTVALEAEELQSSAPDFTYQPRPNPINTGFF